MTCAMNEMNAERTAFYSAMFGLFRKFRSEHGVRDLNFARSGGLTFYLGLYCNLQKVYIFLTPPVVSFYNVWTMYSISTVLSFSFKFRLFSIFLVSLFVCLRGQGRVII